MGWEWIARSHALSAQLETLEAALLADIATASDEPAIEAVRLAALG